ncbi:MAG: hypothetical protein JXR76_12305 [Deltaproteobacteria bacterium]|nr:hypothetical protein [Deltaproteobacteria bacterium]
MTAKTVFILSIVFLLASCAAQPAPQPVSKLPKQISDEELINSLLGAEIATDPITTNTEEESVEQDTEPMEFEIEE